MTKPPKLYYDGREVECEVVKMEINVNLDKEKGKLFEREVFMEVELTSSSRLFELSCSKEKGPITIEGFNYSYEIENMEFDHVNENVAYLTLRRVDLK